MMYLDPDSAERIKHLSEHYEMKPQYILKGLEDGHNLDEIEQFLILDDLLFKRGWSVDEVGRFRNRVLEMAYSYQVSYLELLREGDLRTFEQATERLDKIEAHLSEVAESKDAPEVGKHRGVKNGRFDKAELNMGVQVELEHTKDYATAKEIAKDHLAEIPDYYTRLLKMEREAGVKMEAPGRKRTPEEQRLRELATGKRKMEPEDLALFGLGSAIATIAPSPIDALYFHIERWLDEHRYDLSPTKYWVYRALNYYVTDSAWHWGLLAWILISRRPVKEKTEVYFSLLSAGAVVALLFDYIRDEKRERGIIPAKPQAKAPETPQNAPGGPGTSVLMAPEVGYPIQPPSRRGETEACERGCQGLYNWTEQKFRLDECRQGCHEKYIY